MLIRAERMSIVYNALLALGLLANGTFPIGSNTTNAFVAMPNYTGNMTLKLSDCGYAIYAGDKLNNSLFPFVECDQNGIGSLIHVPSSKLKRQYDYASPDTTYDSTWFLNGESGTVVGVRYRGSGSSSPCIATPTSRDFIGISNTINDNMYVSVWYYNNCYGNRESLNPSCYNNKEVGCSTGTWGGFAGSYDSYGFRYVCKYSTGLCHQNS